MDIASLTPKQLIKRQFKASIYLFFGGLFIAVLLAFPVKWLWNWLTPDLWGWPAISVLQAWGITFLAGLIFKPNVTINEPKPKEQDKK